MQPSRREFVRAGVGLTLAGVAALGAVDELLARRTKRRQNRLVAHQTGRHDSVSRRLDHRRRPQSRDRGCEFAARARQWLRLAGVAAQMLVDTPDAELEDFQSRHQRQQGISARRALADRLPRPEARCAQHSHRRQRFLARRSTAAVRGTVEKYETDYRALIKRTKEALPNVRLVICEPFVLKAGDVDDKWFPGFDGYRAAARSDCRRSGGARSCRSNRCSTSAVKICAAGYVGGRRRPSVAERRGA